MSSTRKIRCVLAQDHLLLRQGLRRLFQDEPDIEVVAEAGDASEALQCIFEHRPEVVIADASIFDLTRDQVQSLIAHHSPMTRVLFLNVQDNDDKELGNGSVEGKVESRRTSAQELAQMIRGIHVAKTGLHELSRTLRIDTPEDESGLRKRSLTAREREVLKLLAEGRTVRSAATELGLSVKTVDAHKFNLMRKLGIHNKAELVMWAIQQRLVKMPSNI